MNDYDPDKILDILLQSHNRHKYFPYVFIKESHIIQLCNECKEIFLNEPSILELSPPINVCGDTHGQFTDTLRIFDVSGRPPEHKYLFLGDYVDRGPQSIENIVLVLLLKRKYRDRIYLIRGNHETEEISTVYGLRDECVRRYSFTLYSEFLSVFDTMPFAAIIENSIFCVHGGIPHSNVTLETLRQQNRPLDVTDICPVTDILWSDPDISAKGFVQSSRGVSFKFGRSEAQSFLKKNNLQLIIRSHEFCFSGASFPFGSDHCLLTIFSASNYCQTMNTSSAISIDENLKIHFSFFEPVS